MYNYFAARYGEPKAQQLRELRWQLPVASLQRRGKDPPIGLPVRDYKENYETLVYGKGAEFSRHSATSWGRRPRPAAANLPGTLSLAHCHAGGVSGAGGRSIGQGFGRVIEDWVYGQREPVSIVRCRGSALRLLKMSSVLLKPPQGRDTAPSPSAANAPARQGRKYHFPVIFVVSTNMLNTQHKAGYVVSSRPGRMLSSNKRPCIRKKRADGPWVPRPELFKMFVDIMLSKQYLQHIRIATF